MVSRRAVLVALGGAGVGAVGYSQSRRVRSGVESAAEGVSVATGPPATDTKIGELTRRSIITRIEFFESGAAKLHPTANRGCYDSIAFRHSATSLSYGDSGLNTDDALATWSFGDFDEVLTVDMLGAMDAKSNYPSREFVLQFYAEDGVCFASGGEAGVRVPGEWLP